MRAIAPMLGIVLAMIEGLFGLHAQAGEAPSIVIPSRPGVPVIINGGDASYCVVEGDVGLERPGMRVTVVACPPQHPIPSYEGSYFPAFGRRPGYGRLEVEPPPDRGRPKPATGTGPRTPPGCRRAAVSHPPMSISRWCRRSTRVGAGPAGKIDQRWIRIDGMPTARGERLMLARPLLLAVAATVSIGAA